ncbi:MAG: hypothetical protein U0Z44_11570 [Kouleothrix sp.]
MLTRDELAGVVAHEAGAYQAPRHTALGDCGHLRGRDHHDCEHRPVGADLR